MGCRQGARSRRHIELPMFTTARLDIREDGTAFIEWMDRSFDSYPSEADARTAAALRGEVVRVVARRNKGVK